VSSIDNGSSVDITDREGKIIRTVALGKCGTGDAARSATGNVVIACGLSSTIAVVSPATGKVENIETMVTSPMSIAATGSHVHVGGYYGEVDEIDLRTRKSSVVGYGAGGCLLSATTLAVTSDKRRVFSIGSGGGSLCSFRFTDEEQRPDLPWKRDALMLMSSNVRVAVEGAALSPNNDALTLGLSDGSIWTIDPNTFVALNYRRPVGAGVTGIAYSNGGAQIVSVTRSGDVIRYDTTRDHEPYVDLIDRLAARVAVGERAGLFRR
jgi:hypothetical protein